MLMTLIDVRRWIDLSTITISCYLSTLLVFNNWIPDASISFPPVGVLWICSVVVFWPFLIRERKWRMVSAYDAIRLTKGAAVLAVCFSLTSFFFFRNKQFFSWTVFHSMLSLIGLCAVRLIRRLVFEHSISRANIAGLRTLIVGTGSPALSLAQRFKREPALGVKLIGFVADDNKAPTGTRIAGMPIVGTVDTFEQILIDQNAQQVIFSQTFRDGSILRNLLQVACRCGVKAKMMAHLGPDGEKGNSIETVREINLSDLLKRPRVEVDLEPTFKMVKGQTVMVTGAGGSIGSELVRQLIRMKPERILLLDQSELNLYSIDSELKELGMGALSVPVLSDLKEPELLRQLMQKYKPNLIFHAAAYKHVHLVEANACAAILNNLTSTNNLLQACLEHDVQYFVMISSDKAVNPLGIMGATKRACEILVSQIGESQNRNYCSVRFGNVLGSSGSFIPLLKNQILSGGPVTITHPNMERYFMLIPEAVSLVLKTASMSKPGDINILRMGDSIRIIDVAKSLITLLGKKEEDIPIVFTGIRPGEKLKEELYISGNEIETQHPDILILPRGAQSKDMVTSLDRAVMLIHRVIELAKSGTDNAGNLLLDLVNDSNHSEFINEEGNSNETSTNFVA